MRASAYALLTVLLAGSARAEVPLTIAIIGLVPVDPADAVRAETVDGLLAIELARGGARVVTRADLRAVIGQQRERELLGCDDASCFAELGGAVGAQWLVHGRLARLGGTIVVDAAIIDARTGIAAGRVAAVAGKDEELLDAAARAGASLAASVTRTRPGPAPASSAAPAIAAAPAAPAARDGLLLRVRVGNALAKLPELGSSYALDLGLEGAWAASDHVDLFGSAGTSLRREEDGLALALFPLHLGAGWLFRDRVEDVVPHASFGLSAQVLNPNRFDPGSLLGGRAGVGLAWFPWERVGVELELGGNLGLGQVDGEAGLGGRFGLDVGLVFDP